MSPTVVDEPSGRVSYCVMARARRQLPADAQWLETEPARRECRQQQSSGTRSAAVLIFEMVGYLYQMPAAVVGVKSCGLPW